MAMRMKWIFTLALLVLFVCLNVNVEAMAVKNEDDQEEFIKWCIAKPSTPDDQLDKIVEFSCSQRFRPINCSIIQPGGKCYNPSNKVAIASVVMNLYFQGLGHLQSACCFNGSGLIIDKNPSIGSCIYPVYPPN